MRTSLMRRWLRHCPDADHPGNGPGGGAQDEQPGELNVACQAYKRSRRRSRAWHGMLLAAVCVVGWRARAGIQVVDVIPFELSLETGQNSEPSLGVQPGPYAQGQRPAVILHAFLAPGSGPHPCFLSTDGGTIWTNFQSISNVDATAGWGVKAYLARLRPDFNTLDVLGSPSPQNGNPLSLIVGSDLQPGSPDQPALTAATFGGVDHLYVGFNSGRAGIHFSLDGGLNWITKGIEQLQFHDAPSVRVAAARDGHTVYGVFERWTGGQDLDNQFGGVVVVRDDNQGLNSFTDLGSGSVVANVTFPTSDFGGASLGAERLNGDCAIAVHPCDPARVYVAFTEVVPSGNFRIPRVRVFQSTDSGAHWTGVLTTVLDSALPALAVAADPNNCRLENSTVGLLYTAMGGGMTLETHLFRAVASDLGQSTDVMLARFPNNTPPGAGDPYIGDFQTLKAVDNTFYGTFSASGDPDPANFPSGAFFQRAVKVNNILFGGFTLTKKGTLTDQTGAAQVSVSIDPFFFKVTPLQALQIGSIVRRDKPPPDISPEILMRVFWLPDPPPGIWNGILESRTSLGPFSGSGGGWLPVPNSGLQFTNGEADVTLDSANGIDLSAGSLFFRARLDRSANSLFTIQPAAGAHGTISPDSAVTLTNGQSQSFAAIPNSNYQVDAWFSDGQMAQAGGTTFTVTNIQDNHFVTATFAPQFDLALTKVAMPNPVSVGSNLTYTITVANRGIDTATNVMVLDVLPPGLGVLSIDSSFAGACSLLSDNTVHCTFPSLARGEFATIRITAIPTATGVLINTASAKASQPELDLSNNTNSVVVTVEAAP